MRKTFATIICLCLSSLAFGETQATNCTAADASCHTDTVAGAANAAYSGLDSTGNGEITDQSGNCKTITNSSGTRQFVPMYFPAEVTNNLSNLASGISVAPCSAGGANGVCGATYNTCTAGAPANGDGTIWDCVGYLTADKCGGTWQSTGYGCTTSSLAHTVGAISNGQSCPPSLVGITSEEGGGACSSNQICGAQDDASECYVMYYCMAR